MREKPRRERKNKIVNVERQKVQKLKKGDANKTIADISTVKCLKKQLD